MTEQPRPPRTRVYVCITCRVEGDAPEGPRAGARLFDGLTVAADPTLDLVPVECLSVCKRPCSVSFAAPGKWTYVYGDLSPEAVPLIREAAGLYAATSDGLIPWKLRPDAIKKGVVARIPPHPIEIMRP